VESFERVFFVISAEFCFAIQASTDHLAPKGLNIAQNNKSLSRKSPPLNIIIFLPRRDKTNNQDTKVDSLVLYPIRRLKAKIA
jgi:hypothetical protein